MTDTTAAPATKRLYRSTRALHLYLGLFISPFLLLYALSGILLVHAWLPWGSAESGEVEERTVPVSVAESDDGLAIARAVRAQLGRGGEIGFVNHDPKEHTLLFPLEKPGERAMVRVDLAKGTAEIERRQTGVWDGLTWLHKMPGPHLVAIRGNWVYMRLWRWLADANAYLVIFLAASGVYLWSVLKVQRRAGLLFLGGGVLSFFLLLLAIAG